MKRQGIFLRTVKSRNRGRASERAVCGVFSDFSLAEPASRPAYAPATKSPARCRAGRAKQYNHARNVKPLPPSKESGAGSARSLVRPIFLCCSLYHAPGLFPCLFIFSLAGPARRRSPARFLLAKKGRIPVPLCSVARISTVYCLCSQPLPPF